LQCDNSGQCRCKPGVTGPKCDRCEANYYDFGTYGCRPCGCVEAGSFDNTPYCDSVTGQCNCKVGKRLSIKDDFFMFYIKLREIIFTDTVFCYFKRIKH